MKNVVLSLALILFCNCSFSQNANYPLKLEKRKVYQNDVVIKGKELKALLMNNPSSLPEFNQFKKNQTIGSVFLISGVGLAAIGGFLSFSESMKELDDVNSGNLQTESNYSGALAAAGIGLVCVLVSVPFNLKARKSFIKSIDQYNSSINNSSFRPVDMNMSFGVNSVRFSMKF